MASARTQSVSKVFRTRLESTGDRLRWVIARVPFDIEKAWPSRNGRRVQGQINGFPFRTTLFPNARDGGHTLLVNKTMQSGARAHLGDEVEIRLEPDLQVRPDIVPEELTRVLKGERSLQKWFAGLAPSFRRWVTAWVSQPKNAESRARRAEQCAEWLLLAMEAERETPPLLRVAFDRSPGAKEGWAAMTKIRRRNHLLSIFHYQTPAARERRVQVAVQDALKVAAGRGKAGNS